MNSLLPDFDLQAVPLMATKASAHTKATQKRVCRQKANDWHAVSPTSPLGRVTRLDIFLGLMT